MRAPREIGESSSVPVKQAKVQRSPRRGTKATVHTTLVSEQKGQEALEERRDDRDPSKKLRRSRCPGARRTATRTSG